MDRRKDYRVIVYDAFFHDFLWGTETFHYTEDDAIEDAKMMYFNYDDYTDEVQLYIRCLGGEWQMIGYIDEDENGKLYVEECFC